MRNVGLGRIIHRYNNMYIVYIMYYTAQGTIVNCININGQTCQ